MKYSKYFQLIVCLTALIFSITLKAAPVNGAITLEKGNQKAPPSSIEVDMQRYYEAIFPSYVLPSTYPSISSPEMSSHFLSLFEKGASPEASCPTSKNHRMTNVAGVSTNSSFPCAMGQSHLLPFFKINSQIFNNRSFDGNYRVTGGSLIIHRFGMSMDEDCINCIRPSETGLEPERIGQNYALHVAECNPSWPICNPPSSPLNSGKPTLINFHQSGLKNNQFEFAFMSHINGCEDNANIEVMADLCSPDHWVEDLQYQKQADKLLVTITAPANTSAARYTAVLKKNSDSTTSVPDRICARENMLNTVAPDITQNTHTISERQEICLNIPTNPQPTQYILATANQPDGRCSCNLVSQEYLNACTCNTGAPRLAVQGNTKQICFTNINGSLNDAVVFMTKDTEAYLDSRTCALSRPENFPDFYSNNSLNHALFLTEDRFNPAP